MITFSQVIFSARTHGLQIHNSLIRSSGQFLTSKHNFTQMLLSVLINTFTLSSLCILLFCSVVCDVWVTVSVYRVITAVGRGWTGWIFTMTILSFMLQVGLHTLPLPAYHDTPAANITRVTHSHILAKYPLHRNKTESSFDTGEASNLSASTIFTLFTHYTADKRVGNMKYSKFQQNQDKQKDKCFILKFVVFIQNIYSALKISHPSPLKFASLVRLFLARSDIILLNVFFSLGNCTLLQ